MQPLCGRVHASWIFLCPNLEVALAACRCHLPECLWFAGPFQGRMRLYDYDYDGNYRAAGFASQAFQYNRENSPCGWDHGTGNAVIC